MIHLRVWIRSLSQRSILQQHVRTLTIKDTTNTYYHFAQREKVNSGSRTLKEPSGYVSTDDEAFDSEGPPPDPPNPFIAVSAMGIGAFFAIGIAAVGVYGSFYMAAWAVANSSLFPKIDTGPKDEEAENEFRTFLKDKLGIHTDPKDKESPR